MSVDGVPFFRPQIGEDEIAEVVDCLRNGWLTTGAKAARVQRSLKSKREQNFFIVSVISLFLLTAIGIIGYLLSNFIFLSNPGSQDTLTQFTQHSENLLTLLRNLFSKGNISIIGSVFSFILLISGYFFYESLRHSRHH
jgi:hypothetical protein